MSADLVVDLGRLLGVLAGPLPDRDARRLAELQTRLVLGRLRAGLYEPGPVLLPIALERARPCR